MSTLDVDETNQVLAVANIQSRFEKTQAIPELDCYTYSKLYTEAVRTSATIKTTALTTSNVLGDFDGGEIVTVPLAQQLEAFAVFAAKTQIEAVDAHPKLISSPHM